MKSGVSLKSINEMMPAGWTVMEAGFGLYNIQNEIGGVWVGHIRALDGKISINVVENDPQGEAFWRAFGLLYADYNPFDLRFGVVYLPDTEEELWELDKFPGHDPQEVVKDLARYAKVKKACYVSFLFGDWHTGEEILTKNSWFIGKNGKLGPNQGALLFLLGKMENESSMV